ncbi:MAG TPA: hypothetical protein PL137_22625 [Nocardioides sp.]|nr:hypothetical protein [Nocardioides sp.]
MTPPQTATPVHPEVAAFVAQVRGQLDDLPEDQREELLEGLEADLSEQVAAGDRLPDPVTYAAELRAAAGLTDPSPGRGRGRGRGRTLRPDQVLDRCRAEWLSWTVHNAATQRAWSLVEAVRPAWWVLRAWIAVTLLDQLAGDWEYVTLWPTLGVPLLGPALLLGAVVVSVLIGQGKLWPGSGPDRTTAARLVLLALNVFAVLAPFTFTGDGSQHDVYGSSPRAVTVHGDDRPARLQHGREVVRNIYAYDAAGQPLQGVQLYDQAGRPVSVAPQSSLGRGREREVTCPWFNGTTPLYNVFPLPQRTQPYGTCVSRISPDRAGVQAFREPPLASVPPVSAPSAPASGPTATP